MSRRRIAHPKRRTGRRSRNEGGLALVVIIASAGIIGAPIGNRHPDPAPDPHPSPAAIQALYTPEGASPEPSPRSERRGHRSSYEEHRQGWGAGEYLNVDGLCHAPAAERRSWPTRAIFRRVDLQDWRHGSFRTAAFTPPLARSTSPRNRARMMRTWPGHRRASGRCPGASDRRPRNSPSRSDRDGRRRSSSSSA